MLKTNRIWTAAPIVFVLALSPRAHADFSYDKFPQRPDILARLIASTETSGGELRSAVHGDTSYYLRSAAYIGSCEAPFGRVHAAELFFIRSAPRGTQLPARGHPFLVFFDSDLKVRASWRLDLAPGSVWFEGTKLVLDKKPLFDFAQLPEKAPLYEGAKPERWVILDGKPQVIPEWKATGASKR